MTAFLKYLPSRRLELGATAGLMLALTLMTWLNRGNSAGALWAIVDLELALPPVLGIVSAGLLAGDPALDLLLSVPRPAFRTLLERASVLFLCGLLLALIVHGLTVLYSIPIPMPVRGWQQILISVAPTLFFIGIATLGATIRGRMLDGVVLVIGAWAWCLFSVPIISDLCAKSDSDGSGAGGCLATIANPAMTYFFPTDPHWLLNRLMWMMIGVILFGYGLKLTLNEERLLRAALSRED